MLNNLKNILSQLINSGHTFKDEEKLEQLRFQIVNFSLILAMSMIPIAMVYNYFLNNFTLIFIEIVVFTPVSTKKCQGKAPASRRLGDVVQLLEVFV